MSDYATTLMRMGLTLLQGTGLGAALAPHARGKGVIFTLHSVRPEPPQPFEPNRILKVTPAFLEEAILTVREAGYDIVSLDEVAARLKSDAPSRPFACFTLDDGYRDNRDYAYPVFKRHEVPFAIYVPTQYADGRGDLWWLVLETAIRKASRVRAELADGERVFDTATTEGKERAFCQIYRHLRAGPEHALRAAVARIAAEAGYDPSTLCRDLIMDWDELRALAADPLVTIGAHTLSHFAVAKLPEDEARAEIAGSVARIAHELARPCRHFSFPYGDAASAGPRDFAIAAALGLETAVTTRKDVLRAGCAATSLPRVSLNGDFQQARYLKAMLTGVPFLAFNAAKAALGRMTPARKGVDGGVTAAVLAAGRPGAASS